MSFNGSIIDQQVPALAERLRAQLAGAVGKKLADTAVSLQRLSAPLCRGDLLRVLRPRSLADLFA